MLNVGSKQIPETLEELVDPAWTCLLIHDVQNDYCAPGGKLFSKFDDSLAASTRQAVERIGVLAQMARTAGVRVIYTRASHLPDASDESPVHLRHLLANGQRGAEPNVVLGSWGHAVVDELTPQPGDAEVDKYAFSAFQGTPLDKLLRSFSAQTLVLTGVSSHSGILTTARFALTLDYFTVIPRECVAGMNAAQHEAAMTLLAPDLVALDDVLAVWGG